MSYEGFDTMSQHKSRLHDALVLDSGMQLAHWSNNNDRVHFEANHHTLSLYLADGYEVYQRTPTGWRNGGGPDRFCMMPQHSGNTWDIRGHLRFTHLYYTEAHMRSLAERIWDKSPSQIRLDEQIFAEDPQISSLYRHFFMAADWQDQTNTLMLSSTATLLVTHVLQRYSQLHWAPLKVTGGLAPHTLNRIKAYIDAHLEQPLHLSTLAAQAQLSEFHFARMFKHSTGLAPHQYVMQARLQKAESLILEGSERLTDIALSCGFSSISHLSRRFKSAKGYTPSQLRRM
ncbi:AraC family transcriptional regulator [Terasakiispira papahanaumokuakeensis]|uniref:AraC family transcriptional regulator n=2 Tax=Terasakiispira papahanaumokuakeensis TaxID=197479 RepID=A0A1E2V978_9GAMM|nr:AraC family transcriptional regulator [Terasakiispira papahanaumokuakeensis]